MTEVPAHWTERRFKHVLADKKKVLRPDLPAGSISFGRVVYKDAEVFSEETKASYQEVLSGEFLVNPLNLNYDLLSLRTALSSIDVVVSTGYIVLQSAERLHPNYTRWLLQQFDVAHMKTLGAGVRQTINYADIGNSYFFEPPLPEQIQIASFLDYETAKIDRLIEKQEALIRLLKEKRQAVISHAVTKGLNPYAPLKDSGIEWLGQVPAHWKTTKLVAVAEVIDPNPSHRNPIYREDGYPFISTVEFLEDGQIETNTPRRVDLTTIEDQERRCRFTAKSLAFSRKGTIGAVRKLPTHTRFALLDSVCVINPHENLEPNYLLFWFESIEAQSQMELERRGAALPQLSVGKVRSQYVTLPPPIEQKLIVEKVSAACGKLQDSKKLADRQITLLQERRTALISAAVTGKIDVRHWKPPVGDIAHSN
jgi:type I restriction enzyme S subunit